MSAATQAFARATLYTDGTDYRLIHLSPAAIAPAAALLAEINTPFCALIADKDEVTLLLAASVCEGATARFLNFRVSEAYRLITFDLPLNFDLVGFMALVSHLLAEAGVSILALSAFERDHIFVPAHQFPLAWDTLRTAQSQITERKP